jgi:DNA primase
VVETIRRQVDIVEMVSRYVKLKKTGGNYVGLCPFHTEKTPSFTVSPGKGFFHCFGCSASGDVFTFIMKMEGKSFPEALDDLANRCGIELPQRRPVDKRARELRSRLLDLNEMVAMRYEHHLANSKDADSARDYLRSRGLSEETFRRFRLGYARNQWQDLVDHLNQKGALLDDAKMLGLVAQGNRGPYDSLRDRLVFPIHGLDGKIRGFGARKIDEESEGPKYINSRQSSVYDKSEVLYGLNMARTEIKRRSEVILVEGYFDVLSLIDAGIGNVVATCGTALTERHARILRRFTEKVITVFDADPAGSAASIRSARVLLEEDLSPYMVLLPKGEDPDSFVRSQAGDAFKQMIKNARPSLEVLADRGIAEAGEDVEARTRALRELLPLLAACKDSLRLSHYVHFVADRFSVGEGELRKAITSNKKHSSTVRKTRKDLTSAKIIDEQDQMPAAEEETLVVLLMKYPALAGRFSESGILDSFGSAVFREILEQILQSGHASSAASLLSLVGNSDLRGRLSQKLMDDEAFPEDRAEAELDRCVLGIRRKKIRAELLQLTARIGQAEKAGKQDETAQLLKNKMRLNQELVMLDARGGKRW